MIQRYEYYNANIEPRSDGRIVFYADAEKWVRAEISRALADQELRDGAERAEMVRRHREEIAALKEKINQSVNTKP